MKRHVLDGAEILRRTPEMPPIAPVVAFEHHLRQDGTRLSRGRQARSAEPGHGAVLDLGRLRRHAIAAEVSAGVPDRPYQGRARSNDGRQFDRHLVRRFVQLLGIYPPATLVKLNTGEVAVVLTGLRRRSPSAAGAVVAGWERLATADAGSGRPVARQTLRCQPLGERRRRAMAGIHRHAPRRDRVQNRSRSRYSRDCT